MNSQHKNTNSNVDFVPVLRVCFKDFWYTKIIWSLKNIYFCLFYRYKAKNCRVYRLCESIYIENR